LASNPFKNYQPLRNPRFDLDHSLKPKRLTIDEARRIAANIAKLLEGAEAEGRWRPKLVPH
jgi:hypothetical protein